MDTLETKPSGAGSGVRGKTYCGAATPPSDKVEIQRERGSNTVWLIRVLPLLYVLGACSSPPTVSADRRAEIEAQLVERLVELRTEPRDVKVLEIAELLTTFPEFDLIAYDVQGLVSATYVDGVMLLVGANREPSPPMEPVDAAPLTEPSILAPALPGRRQAVLFASLGTCYDASTGELATALGSHGYDVREGAGTIDDWVSLDQVGVLHVNTHAASAFPSDLAGVRGLRLQRRDRPPPQLFVATSTIVSPALDAEWEAALRAGKVAHGIFDRDRVTNADGISYCQPQSHYLITHRMVTDHVQLAPDAFVFLDACESDDARFRDAVIGVGASVYGGWSLPVGDGVAVEAQRAVYERLLGAPTMPPDTLEEMVSAIHAAGADVDPANSGSLTFTSAPNTPPGYQLVPSVRSAIVAAGQLTLTGRFGASPGTVLVDGQETTLVGPWNTNTLVVAVTGSPAAVQVVVDDRRSNVWQLGENGIRAGGWIGTHGIVSKPNIPNLREAGESDFYIRDLVGSTASIALSLYFTTDFYGGLQLRASGGTATVSPTGITVTGMTVRGDQGFDVASASVMVTLSPSGTVLSGSITMGAIPNVSTYENATATLNYTTFNSQ